ncbi:MAG: PorT family protein [Chitinispirillales bacterium]|jgi:hypothetical protein|nr:PorT family protein [Chitinispirillales bacterium]
MNRTALRKAIFPVLAMFVLGSVNPAPAQHRQGKEEGSAIVIPEELPEIESFILLNTGFDVGFGNITADGYAATGREGQAHITPFLGFMKPMGPFILSGNVSNSMGLTSPHSSSLLGVDMTPLLRIPSTNFIVGTMLSLTLPFHEGRLISNPAQIPPNSPLPAIADMGITPGVRYTHPLDWGALSGTFLFTTSRLMSHADWNIGGSAEFGVRTNMGIYGHIAPNFSLLEMGEKAIYRYSSLRTQIGYVNPEKTRFSGTVSFYLPGSQEDGFDYGISAVPALTYMINQDFAFWASVGFYGIGNNLDTKLAIAPQVGLELGIPFIKWASTINAVEAINHDSSKVLQNREQPKLHIGVAGGHTSNILHTSTACRPFTEYESCGGFEIAVPVRYRFRNWFAIQGELQYIQKNYTMRRDGPYDGVYNTVTNGFIDVPLLANMSFGWEQFRIFGNFGAYGGGWVHSHRVGRQLQFTDDPFNPGGLYYHDYDEKVKMDAGRDARFDGGLLSGMGFQYTLPNYILFMEGRYYYGLTDLQQNYGYNLVPRMNNTFNVRLGALFNRNIFNR